MRALLAAHVLALGVACLGVAPARAEGAATCTPDVIAHRGDTTRGATEESVASMVSAAQRGADFVEFDVQAASNGVLYAMHDATLARTVQGSPRGGIGDHTSTELNAMRLEDGSRIPHVSDLFDAVKPYPGVGVFLELKAVRDDTYRRLRALTLRFGPRRVVVTSFDPGRVARYHAVAPRQRVALISATARPVRSVAPYQGLALRASAATPAYLDRLGAAGLRRYLWTVSSVEAWAALPTCPDGVFTDDLSTVPGRPRDT